ncbi:hypothetical protein ACFSR9_11010 [Deinococcus taklimakanensis]|uniref:Uncharacterized protein n=1 Tax=Deinococcus taklimakanensis TaxID=536443 RepID=A0ABW5P3V6_9DEIO
MLRVLIALLGVLLLACTALALVWLAGQLLAGMGLLLVGTAGVLLRLLWFLLLAGVLGGLVFFVTNAWRPASAGRPLDTAYTGGVVHLGQPVAPAPDAPVSAGPVRQGPAQEVPVQEGPASEIPMSEMIVARPDLPEPEAAPVPDPEPVVIAAVPGRLDGEPDREKDS